MRKSSADANAFHIDRCLVVYSSEWFETLERVKRTGRRFTYVHTQTLTHTLSLVISYKYALWRFARYNSKGDYSYKRRNYSNVNRIITSFTHSEHILFTTMFIVRLSDIVCSLFRCPYWKEDILSACSVVRRATQKQSGCFIGNSAFQHTVLSVNDAGDIWFSIFMIYYFLGSLPML